MNISIINWIIAVFPIFLLVVLMAVCRWPAGKAAGITLCVTVFCAVCTFGADLNLIIFESLKGVWNTATTLWIIAPAILLYETLKEFGSLDYMNIAMSKLSPNSLFKVLTVGWVFAGFLQGISGFGVPVAICVPILMGLGMKPGYAIMISLLGQSWGNTFGTLSVAWDVMVDISKIEGEAAAATALYASALLWVLDLLIGITICYLFDRFEGVKNGLVYVILISLVHGGGEILLSQYNTSIACFVPTTVAMVLAVCLSRLKIYRKEYSGKESRIMKESAQDTIENNNNSVPLIQTVMPYLILIFVTIVLLVIEPINGFLKQISWGFAFPETSTAFGFTNGAEAKYSPFYPCVDSGTVLFITAIVSYIYLKNKNRGNHKFSHVVKKTVRRVKPTAVAILLLLVISKLMSGTGETLIIAQGIAGALGDKFVLLAGFVGLIGSFITGSNMSSNILFTDVQVKAAMQIGADKSVFLALQTAGAAVGSVISPNKIILGTTSAGNPGEEGTILKKLLPFALSVTLVMGLICMVILLVK